MRRARLAFKTEHFRARKFSAPNGGSTYTLSWHSPTANLDFRIDCSTYYIRTIGPFIYCSFIARRCQLIFCDLSLTLTRFVMYETPFSIKSQLATFKYAVCFEVPPYNCTLRGFMYALMRGASLVTLGLNFLCYRVVTRHGVYTIMTIYGDSSQGQCLTFYCHPTPHFRVLRIHSW